MPAAFGVTVQDVAAEVASLMPQGISETTRPSRALVEAFIAEADARLQLALAGVAAGTPTTADAAYPLARKYVVQSALGETLRILYTGKVSAPELVDLMERFAKNSADVLKAIVAFGEQAVGTTVETPPANVVFGDIPLRELMVSDDDLDGSWRRF